MTRKTVKVEWISLDDLLPLILLAFRDDAELPRWHISPGTPEHMAEHTYENIRISAASYTTDCYRVLLDEDGVVIPIGFTVLTMDPLFFISSFGINVQYRRPEILLPWLDQVSALFGGPYSVVLWRKNRRAIRFFQRNGYRNVMAKDKFIQLWQ